MLVFIADAVTGVVGDRGGELGPHKAAAPNSLLKAPLGMGIPAGPPAAGRGLLAAGKCLQDPEGDAVMLGFPALE